MTTNNVTVERDNHHSFLISVYLTAFVFLLYALSTLGFYVGVPMNASIFPISVVLTGYLFNLYGVRKFNLVSTKGFIVLSAWAIIALLSSIAINYLFYDVSWDGQTYHLEGVIALDQGWDPVYSVSPDAKVHDLWLTHYPKFTWVIGAAVYSFFGAINTVKFYNLLFVIIAFLYSRYIYSNIFKLGKGYSFLLALLTGITPITAVQLFTNYVDGLLHLVFAITLLGMYTLLFDKDRKYRQLHHIVVFSNLIFMINIKMTGAVYACILVFIFGILQLIYLRKVKLAVVKSAFLLCSVLLGLTLFGMNPYITNIVNKGHIFYPLMGKNKMVFSQGGEFDSYSPVKKFWLSISSRPVNSVQTEEMKRVNLQAFKPANIVTDFKKFFIPDMRTNAFGPLSFPLFILSGILILYVLAASRRQMLTEKLFLIVSIIGTVMVNSEAWQLRYASQLWLLFVAVLLFVTQEKKLHSRVISFIISAIMLTNIYGIFTTNFSFQILASDVRENEFAAIKQEFESVQVNFNTFYSTRILFQEHDIPYEEINEPPQEFRGFSFSDIQFNGVTNEAKTE
ncbi:Putative uncharacterized protein [Thermobacillus xylanilyticus]|uniref:Glycosyltransferase RgtA/B/C/D-like domain-containing protein n=1 Tax=Thermobacillus xylanilyticus TaxID=76633 RepID=A0ABM8V874_THEXY|nr:hypothetical protein [Thermobacillus xylanilyticus]CAG5091998.1 Putative uncharacterized protein [Thermobacillus xylanilyticus]